MIVAFHTKRHRAAFGPKGARLRYALSIALRLATRLGACKAMRA